MPKEKEKIIHIFTSRIFKIIKQQMIQYTYTASGIKISQQLVDDGRNGDERRYMGPFVFSGNALNWVNLPHGRIVLEKMATPTMEYHLRDHLGNTRIALLENQSDNTYIIQQDVSYYPYGMPIANLTNSETYIGGTPANRYLYNGKELQDDFDLNWYDYGARFYDAQIGRWHTVDPMAEKYYSISPYAYVANNPIRYIDPDGKRIWPGEGLITANNLGKVDSKTLRQVQVSQGKQGAVGVAVAATAVGGYVWGPTIVAGTLYCSSKIGMSATVAYSNLALTLKLTPEMLKYIAISNPRLYRAIVAAIEANTPAIGGITLSNPVDTAFAELIQLLLGMLQQDSGPQQKDNTQTSSDTDNTNQDDGTTSEATETPSNESKKTLPQPKNDEDEDDESK